MLAGTVVWVFGDSAAGKETFIRAIVEKNPPQQLLEHLGWQRKQIVVCKESLEYIGQFKDDPTALKREQVIPSVVKLSKANDVILIKGQIVDLEASRLQRLKRRLNKAQHEVIYIEAGTKEPYGRLPRKSYYKGTETKAEMIEWRETQIRLLNKLASFHFVGISGKAGEKYASVHLPTGLKQA
ncbi:hypothetical protein EXS54_03230 [Patescibacteria group bacterium]|nr:hypothetical protein [Patescibacteria group bacterium]